MTFKDIIGKIRRILLCGGNNERRPSMDIGSPTNIRHLDVGNYMPQIMKDLSTHHHTTGVQAMRERYPNPDMRKLSLQSHPPTRSCSPDPSYSPSEWTSAPSSRSTSATLLNNASVNLPTNLPTPPRRQHSDASSPSFRMKSMQVWDRTRCLSASFGGCREFDIKESKEGEASELDSDYDFGIGTAMGLGRNVVDCEFESLVSEKSTPSLGDFTAQDIVAGGNRDHCKGYRKDEMKPRMKEAFSDGVGNRSSSDDEENFAVGVAAAERWRLVKA